MIKYYLYYRYSLATEYPNKKRKIQIFDTQNYYI